MIQKVRREAGGGRREAGGGQREAGGERQAAGGGRSAQPAPRCGYGQVLTRSVGRAAGGVAEPNSNWVKSMPSSSPR